MPHTTRLMLRRVMWASCADELAMQYPHPLGVLGKVPCTDASMRTMKGCRHSLGSRASSLKLGWDLSMACSEKALSMRVLLRTCTLAGFAESDRSSHGRVAFVSSSHPVFRQRA